MMLLERAQGDAALRRGSARAPLRVMFVADHLGHAGGVIHGASRYYLEVLPRLDPARVGVSLCILRGRHPFAGELERAGITPEFLGRGKWDPRALRDLARAVRRGRIDLLHCLAMKGCLFGRLVARHMGIPALIHLHDTNDPGLAVGALQRRVAPYTARALAVSQRVADFTRSVMGVPADRIQVLHNGLDVDAFAHPEAGARERVRAELGIAADARVIVLVGRVVPGKGQRELISLMPRILASCPGAVLLIVGDGPDLGACRVDADRLGVTRALRFAGQRVDIPAILAAADVGVMPSLADEGFGYAALEASAAGRPVVVFEGGALREIVLDGITGRVIPRGEMGALAGALVALLTDPSTCQRMGAAGAAHARAFGIDRHVRQLEEIYEQLAAARAGGGQTPR
jgi:glycosyltransferase involved in cell wall biosynthesis